MFLIAHKKGFSLIETCIYMALLSFFITSTAVVVWQIMGGVRSVAAQLHTEQEGMFVIQKIEQLLRTAEVVTPVSGTSSMMIVQDDVKGASLYTVRHNSASSSIELQRNAGGVFIPLTTNAAIVSELVFYNLPKVGDTPARLGVTMIINGQVFEMKYLLERR